MNFRKGSRDGFAKLTAENGFDGRAEIVRRHLAEVFGSRNLSFLMGSGCSSFVKEGQELGIPTMGPLAREFQDLPGDSVFVRSAQIDALRDRLGIDLKHPDFRDNLERMMEVLMTAHRFSKASGRADLHEALADVEDTVTGIKRFILRKCTPGRFAEGDETVVSLYRRFYQSLATRSRGLAPPWVFTTNYDLFNERAMDRSGIPYSNGFSGTVERRFNPSTYRRALAEQLDISPRRWAAVDGYVHLCKLHGSVNWTE